MLISHKKSVSAQLTSSPNSVKVLTNFPVILFRWSTLRLKGLIIFHSCNNNEKKLVMSTIGEKTNKIFQFTYITQRHHCTINLSHDIIWLALWSDTCDNNQQIRTGHYLLKGADTDGFQRIPEQKELLKNRLSKEEYEEKTF